ncbi:MAG TPA: bifunctional phosphopantothenoylcysteine decarboxylase/phosphopantothenate--cysteine ligase CoaBC [Ornithinimicrobium sp.]|uniref:bifunctional phosphopantothenoylcysteine decarboxylase/phosphopantothenate--cysteine ligase CoaBC n=1 Tax=Ornithinimicrobium sp. TaxID=1977084 RepID=UPI002B45BE4D|nr:bifunctional phosphopantothenoylcysteine decarboxylase/phosphopantothenate--cysteine ligase CoaBC [Ornithinimicrobium sp.]HKJ11878.1 bifunctional phosphopantothenoylcysteine decarboxylase/phosphopantothenate--cysteine ligase CoaBC [Ornithinimicrobium sp.]
MQVVLGVGGGIAAYKACSLLRRMVTEGHDVQVVPTQAALQFVGEATWAALSGRAVSSRVWDDVHEVPHVRVGQQADLVIVAPATADLLAQAAHGLAGDLLGNVLLTTRAPVVLAPAMHTEMWQHPATVANVRTLRGRGVHVLEPGEGRLTGADSGPGRLAEPEDIYAAALEVLEQRVHTADPDDNGDEASSRAKDLAGWRVLVTAGGTREPLDPVRFLGNRSSGKQGVALASAAAQRGAEVTLVAADVSVDLPDGMQVRRVGPAREMEQSVHELLAREEYDAVVMSAAVADYRPAEVAEAKMKKSPQTQDGLRLDLVRNPDILAGLVRQRGEAPAPILVGFAAETGDAEGDVLHHARQKLQRKGCDILVANDVGAGGAFGSDQSTVHILRSARVPPRTVGPASKTATAHAVWDAVLEADDDRAQRR